MKEVATNIYQLSLPLVGNPLKEVHIYIIKGQNSSLLIDTGFNNIETQERILAALKTLEIEFLKLKVFISHLHADHSGLASYFYQQGCQMFASEPDAKIINDILTGQFENTLNERIHLLDLNRYKIDKHVLPKTTVTIEKEIQFTHLKDKDIITIDEHKFEVIDVAGHTPGMLALYDLNTQNLYSADHILDQISPNISYWGNDFPALKIFLTNLEKTIPMNIKTIFPSHRNIMEDHPRRVKELISHHKERLLEVMNIFKYEPFKLSASELASKMSWNFRAPSWDEFPDPQKFFAAHEAMVHLEYLYDEGKLKKNIDHGIAYYSLI